MKKYFDKIILWVLLILITAGIAFKVQKLSEGYIIAQQASSSIVETTQPETTDEGTTVTELSEEEKANLTLTVTSPDKTQITVDSPVINFCGQCDVNYALTINGNPVTLGQDGVFSYDVNLTAGKNTITVSNGIKTITYTVTYEIKLIDSVSPTKNMKLDGDSSLEISCLALKGSSVYAKINGTTVSMTASDDDAEFIKYFGTYIAPSSSSEDQKLGKIKFYAKNGEFSDNMSGASLTVKAYQLSNIIIEQGKGNVVEPQITGDNVVDVLSPYTDHGKGMARVCVVNADYAETVPASTADDRSDPRLTPVIKGTIDYIKNDVSYDGSDYYVTYSGVKLEKEKTSEINGYILPSNTITTYKSYTSNGYTNAILTMNWKVPFVSEMKEQSFFKGYNGRPFNVSSFTSSYIDFTFSYTNAAEGSFDFSDSNVVNSAKWINIGDNGTTTLRVFFRNSGKFYGYRAYYSNDNRLVISFNEKPTSLSESVFVLDPGHGGKDCGAIGVNGTYESVVNLRIAAYVKQNLENAGLKVVILRTDDTYYSLDERVAMARRAGGDIFVSLHNNSSNSKPSSKSGTEVYYYRANAQQLASCVHSQLVSAWRSVYSNDPAMTSKIVPDDGGVRFYPFRVTRLEECPAILVECGYLSNAVECNKLCNNDVQSRLGKAVSDGIINYFNAQ